MRPVRLTMQAFGPYPEREVIDFRDAVGAGLFGIYGPTGSGKSTIFSAMTFALFGKPAKDEQDAPSLRSDHADASVQTEVEFVFDIAERRYVVLRRPLQMRPKQRGGGETRAEHEAFLFDATGLALDAIGDAQRGKIVAEKKVNVVDAAISEILGYGPDQFRQIVLLPQGKFEAFLSAKTKERVEILRALFDVSLYRSLAAKLKVDAEDAERHVRDEREVCLRRLAAEGFESTDALTAGIGESGALHAKLLEAEIGARMAFETAQTLLAAAEKTEAQFTVAENAKILLAELQARNVDIDSLADRIAQAECARSLLDAETWVRDAAGEIRVAEEKLSKTQEAAKGADYRANSASEVLKMETERAGEIENLRRQVEVFERYKQTLEKSAGITDAVETAQAAERQATGKLDDTQRKLTVLQVNQREKSETLKAARVAEGRRMDIAIRIAALKSSLAAAENFENADSNVLASTTAVEKLYSEHEAATRHAEKTRSKFEVAEQSLSSAQALHLALKLNAGAPCPVCGATEHPAPATRAIEHVESDQAFREAKAAWQQADQAARETAQKLAAAQSVLKDRQDRLASLDHPHDSAGTIKEMVQVEEHALKGLGPQIDPAELEAQIESLCGNVELLEKERDAMRMVLSEWQRKTSSERARLDEMLSTVPERLRKLDSLAATIATASQALTDRQMAKAKAERTATEMREAALVAQKDQEAADNALSICSERHRKAVDAFQSRLEQAGLSAVDFRALKPAIVTIDEDRATVEKHRRKLENAKDTAEKLVEGIREKIRPDLTGIEARRREVNENLIEATDQRSSVGYRLAQLTKLRDELTESLRRLDEAEVASGPLRNLAALVNGDNPQNLDLETYAIGAMFDKVLEAANLRLGPMTANRYRVERDIEGTGRGRRGLGIQVFDIFTGKARPTTTLSGGETFIAALALALGLADVVESASGKVRLDTIFIDEGFGSLDAENGSGTLDQVLQVLSSLVRQNRAVGLISHVPLVQETIPNGFYVRKQLAGSTVEARGVA